MSNLESDEIYLPKEISPDESAMVVALLVASGDIVEQGDSILEVETSKALYQIDAPRNGVIVFHVSEGQFVSSPEKLATITDGAETFVSTNSELGDQAIFTDSASKLLAQHDLKQEDVIKTLSPLRYITSEDIRRFIELNHSGKLSKSKVSGILIIGFGHRGRFLRSLLSDKFEDSIINFVDYSKRRAKTQDHIFDKEKTLYLDELSELDLDDSAEVYWCVPNTLLDNQMMFHFDRLSRFLRTYTSCDAWISKSAEISKSAIIFPGAVVSPNSKIGQGAILESGSIVGTGSIVGRFASLCSNSSLAHDSTLGSCSTLSDGSRIAGRVKIGNHTLVGLNATVNSDLIIGDNVIIHSGANVYKNVPSNCIFTRDGKMMAKAGS